MDIQKNEPIRVLIIVGIVIVIVWGACWWATINFIQTWDHRSSFGEMFGSVNALFSGAALAGVMYAIFLQRRQLELTREELHRSAEAQEKSEKAFGEQIKQMQEQSELQLLPFVILIRDDAPNEIKYMLWNAGNGTALNVKVWITYGPKGEEEPYEYSTRTSILTKDQKDVIDDTNPSALEGNIFTIFFENINKKEYVITGKLQNGRTELLSFDPCN